LTSPYPSIPNGSFGISTILPLHAHPGTVPNYAEPIPRPQALRQDIAIYLHPFGEACRTTFKSPS
jgi:hypothetical protein